MKLLYRVPVLKSKNGQKTENWDPTVLRAQKELAQILENWYQLHRPFAKFNFLGPSQKFHETREGSYFRIFRKSWTH